MTTTTRQRKASIRHSAHSEIRRRQRGITDDRIHVVLAYGDKRRRKGGFVYSMTKRARRRAESKMGSDYVKISDKLNFYVVTSLEDDSVVTVGHRAGRMKWN